MDSLSIKVEMSLEEAKVAVSRALADKGFGILTEIDVAATLKAKIGVERSPLVVLGACNARLANEALNAEPNFALILPCNVVFEGQGDFTHVSIADPRSLIEGVALQDLAKEAAELLDSALQEVAKAVVV